MLGKSHYYNRTIRKMVVAFGTLFNDIQIIRKSLNQQTNYETLKVPISYGPKEKYVTRLASDPNLIKSIGTVVPRISFDMTGLAYDPSRKQSSTIKNYAMNSSGTVNSQYAPIPYNFDFSLSIYVRNTEDGTQIIEQILPFFTPDFTISVDLIEGMDQKYDIPIILESVSPNIDYEGDMSTTRLIIWDLTFTVKGFIFPALNVGGDKIIKRANTNMYIESGSSSSQKAYMNVSTGNGVYTTGETVRVENRGVTGVVTYFANNATGALIVENLSSPLKVNDMVRGDYSNAIYKVDSLELSPLKSVTIVVTPNPATANADDDFGFTETINEWPDTL
jgi:hypothetical protein